MNNGSVLILGGSLTGTKLALDQARAGKRVYLVEKCAGLAGERILASGNFVPGQWFTSPELEEIKKNENIEVITNADLEEAEGRDGNFKVTLRVRASRVRSSRCDDCKACIKVCPINLWDSYNEQLSFRTAIDSFNSQPNSYHIIKEEMPICQETCPVHLDVRGYIGLIADGKFGQALDLIRERLPFPATIGRICPHPCEQKCNRASFDEPLAIRHLKRFVADYEMALARRPKILTPKAPVRHEKVAIIGAGPGGLTCAHDLARLGYQVTVFESLPVAGGMLYVGIPEYRLPKKVLQREIDSIRDIGVEIKTNAPIGGDLTLNDLFRQGFKAVFISVGAHKSQRLQIGGEDAEGVVHGVDFLRDMNLGKEVIVSERVAIIGGGNVAMDAARCSLRLGSKKVFILYRRSRVEMPASKEEIEALEAEGIEIQYLVAPIEVLSDNGKVVGLRCTHMELGEPDVSGRRTPIPIKGSEFDVELGMVIPAIGQTTDLSFLNGDSGIKTTRQGTLVADRNTLATAHPGVFAGGDAVTGPSIAIEAVAAGKRAAVSIDKYLRGE